jgi:hypothetical protein
MSNFGLRTVEEDSNLKFINFDDATGNVTSMECKVTINIFKSLIPEYDSKTFAEKVKFLKDNKLDNIITYRIPTQGLNSITTMVVKEFLPETIGDTIIVPAEFTTLTGSDFDIDKVFVIRYNYRLTNDGVLRKVKFLTGTSEKEVKERYKNRVRDEIRLNKDIFDENTYNTFTLLNNLIKEGLYETEEELRDIIEKRNNIIELDFEPKLLALDIIPKLENFGKLSIIEQNTEEAIQNKMISNYMAILTSKEHFLESVTPLGILADKLKSMAKFVNSNDPRKNKKMTSFGMLTPTFQTAAKAQNTGTSNGIAPFALNKAHHVLAQTNNIHVTTLRKASYYNYNDDLNAVSIAEVFGKDGRYISDWLSVLIDAHVDGVKDPYIMDLNVNQFTYDVTSLLLRSGVGENTFLFLSQPVIVEYVNRLYNSKSVLTDQESEFEILADLREKLNVSDIEEKSVEISEKIFNDNFLVNNIKYRGDRSLMSINDYKANQSVVLEKFLEFKAVASDLFSLVQASQVDTKKYGINIVELFSFINKSNQVKKSKTFLNTEKLFSEGDTFDLNKSFISNYYVNGVLFMKDLLGSSSLYGTGVYNTIINRILELGNISKNLDKKTINILYDEVYAAILGSFFRDEMQITPKRLKTMLTGETNIVKKIAELKADPEFANNSFVKHLISVFEDNDVIPNFFRVPSTRITDKWEKDDLVRGWEDLISHEKPEIRSLAKRLFVYSYYTSGFRNRIFSFFNFIPTSIIKSIDVEGKDVSMDRYIKNKLNDYVRGSVTGELVDEIDNIANEVLISNWNIDTLVPLVNSNHVDKVDKFENGDINYITIKLKGNTNQYVKKYVKLKIGKDFTLLKNIGFTEVLKGSNTFTEDSAAIYVPVNKKGYSSKGVVLVEYGLSESIIESNIIKNKPNESIILTSMKPTSEKRYTIAYSDSQFENAVNNINDTITEKAEEYLDPNNSAYYTGDIIPESNTIFVFGSNPEGRHGAGAAKIAVDSFGAIYGQGEGLQGNAYALPTKDLRVKENKGFKSISPEQIIKNIKKLYNVAIQNPDKQFKIAYRNTTEVSLNGYSGLEMIEMFNKAGAIPSNIIFSKEWFDTGKLNIYLTTSKIMSVVNDMSTYVDHSGGAVQSDTVWGKLGEPYGVTSIHYYHLEKTPNGNTQISNSDAIEGQSKATIAARQMGRIEPTHQIRDNKIIRNWAQVKYADAIFAIVDKFYKPGDTMNYKKVAKIEQGVGGTGYAIQMAINENKPVYVFNQSENSWYTWLNNAFVKTEIPILTPNFAGIGTSTKLKENGVKAIESVYANTQLAIELNSEDFEETPC